MAKVAFGFRNAVDEKRSVWLALITEASDARLPLDALMTVPWRKSGDDEAVPSPLPVALLGARVGLRVPNGVP